MSSGLPNIANIYWEQENNPYIGGIRGDQQVELHAKAWWKVGGLGNKYVKSIKPIFLSSDYEDFNFGVQEIFDPKWHVRVWVPTQTVLTVDNNPVRIFCRQHYGTASCSQDIQIELTRWGGDVTA